MPARRRLRDVPLTGWRRFTRAALLRSIAGLSVLTLVLLVIEEHRRDIGSWNGPQQWGPWHSFALETAGLPLIGVALTFGAAMWGRRFPLGVFAGLLATMTAAGIALCFIAIHLFDEVDGNVLAVIALLQVPLFFAGALLTVAELALPILERRRLERDEDPVFPSARVVA